MVLIVMGVSGCGKSTVGKGLAARLGLPFFDADDFHPAANVEKMANGIPLQDEDRWPWLDRLHKEMEGWEETGGAVLACSALKHVYRDRMQAGMDDNVHWIYLKGSFELIAERLRSRKNHYMPPELLASQFDALEEPASACTVEISAPVDSIIEQILSYLNRNS